MSRYVITVDQGAIQRGERAAIHLHDTQTSIRLNGDRLVVNGTVTFVSDPTGGLADGARVWAETDSLPLLSVVE